MYQQQRINIAGRITNQPISVLRAFFSKPEDYSAFLRAEAEGRLMEFLPKTVGHLAPQTREALAQYPAIYHKLNGIRQTREELQTTLLDDPQSFQAAQQKGVLAEWHFLQVAFEDSFLPQHRKVLQLLAEEIRLLDEFAALIIGLVPDQAALELPGEDQLIEWLEQEDWQKLGRAILQHLDPKEEGTLVDLAEPIKPMLQRSIQKYISACIKADTRLSEETKQELFSSHQAFLDYVARQDDPIYPAFIALTLEAFSQRFQHSGKYLSTLKELAGHYSRFTQLEGEDYAALIRLYEFILERLNWLYDQAVQSENPEFAIRTEWELHLNLGRWYARVWEVDAAALHYKEAAFLAFAQDWHKEFEGALFRLMECYQRHLREEQLLDLIPKVLAGDAGWMGIVEAISLSPRLRESLEVLLLEGLHNRSVSPDAFLTVQQLFQTNIGQEMARQMHLLQEEQPQPGKAGLQLSGPVRLSIAPLHSSHEHWLEELEYAPPEVYRRSLQLLDRQALDLWPPHRLHLRLHQARLRRLQGSEQAVSAFNRLLPEMERWPYFSESKKAYWQIEFISAIALCVGRKPLLAGSIDQAVHQVLTAIGNSFLESYLERNALPGTMSELDRLVEALLLNIKRVTSSTIRQGLLRTLWQVLVFRQQFVIGLWGKGRKKNAPNPAYQERLQTFEHLLWHWHQQHEQKQELALYQIIREIRAFDFSGLQPAFRLPHHPDPTDHTLLFSFLQKEGTHRQALVMAYLPQKDLKKGEGRYALKILDHFEEVDKYLGTEGDLQAWKALVENTDFIGALYDQLLEFGPSASESTALDGTAQRLALYADPILTRLPVEALQTPEQPALGEWKNVQIVLKRPRLLEPVALEQGVLFVAETEQADLHTQLDAVAWPAWQVQSTEELHDALGALQPAVLHLSLPLLTASDLPAETSSLRFQSEEADKPALLSYLHLLDMDLSNLGLVILSIPETPQPIAA
ncbi:MAG: hypothetical protein KDC44_20260, partial [Phaeodactylibacter sp.]|nr:hypothetical protein [Phaeodactylibacter sp.]